MCSHSRTIRKRTPFELEKSFRDVLQGLVGFLWTDGDNLKLKKKETYYHNLIS